MTAAGVLLPGLSAGCAAQPLLSPLRLSTDHISPNGSPDGRSDGVADVAFTLGRRANVSVRLTTPSSTSYVLRAEATRAPDDYEIQFRGVVTVPGTENRRVLPDGRYLLTVTAVDEAGIRAEQAAEVTITNGDSQAPEITNLVASAQEFTPNGDGDEDDVTISYGLTKPATVTVYATDSDNRRYLIEAPKKRNAVLLSHLWDGTVGGKVLADGKYTFHVDAEDLAGNFTAATLPITITNAGTARLEIVDARFSPIALAQGGKLNVRIKIRNNGDTHIKTMGPPPGTAYTTQQNFTSFRDPKDPNKALYYERPGRWRVGIQWTNAPQLYPVRWGLFEDDERALAPGEEVTIEGSIQVLESTTHELRFWASIVQEGVGYPGGQVGHTKVTVSF